MGLPAELPQIQHHWYFYNPLRVRLLRTRHTVLVNLAGGGEHLEDEMAIYASIEIHNYVKDFVIPISSPFIAALAIVLVVRQESGKLTLQRLALLDADASSVYRDVNYLIEAYQETGLKKLASAGSALATDLDELSAAFERLWGKFMDNPDVYRNYFLNAHDAL